MEPNKLDQKVNASFEKRTIDPSAQSWEKLSERLHEKEQHKSYKYWLFGVAASFLAGILLTTLYFKGNTTMNTVPVVRQENTMPTSLEEKIQPAKSVFDQRFAKEEVVTVPTEAKASSKNKAEKASVERLEKLAKEKTKLLAYNTSKRTDSAEQASAHVQSTEQLISQASIKIIDDIQKNGVAGQEATAVEINQLIHQAELEVRTTAILKGRENRVDAMALLKSVDDNVDPSFRERVFAAVQDGLHQMKTAIANRNH